jgi:transitional endoplasmic reticulum ATPase
VGKTLIARAIAKGTGAEFFRTRGRGNMSKVAGESEAKLRAVFKQAAEKAPAIIFIDEPDALAPNLHHTGGEVADQVVAQLGALKDGITSRSIVCVIATTSRLYAFDPALRQFGRFDPEVEFGVPDEKGRLEVLKIRTKGMKSARDGALDGRRRSLARVR